MDQRTSFELAEMIRITGADRSFVDYQVRLGGLVPEPASGARRRFSLESVVACNAARMFREHGLTAIKVASLLTNMRQTIAALPPQLRASATFVRYVEMVDALVAINGPGPNYATWRAGVDTFVRTWKTKPAPLAAWQIEPILAGDHSAPTTSSADVQPEAEAQ